jgi:hypothetical protein
MKHIKKFNESVDLEDDDFDHSFHIDDETLEHTKSDVEKFTNAIESVMDELVVNLDEYTTGVTSVVNKKGTLDTGYSKYEYELKITRIG